MAQKGPTAARRLQQTIERWEKKSAGLVVIELQRLKELEEENKKLRPPVGATNARPPKVAI